MALNPQDNRDLPWLAATDLTVSRLPWSRAAVVSLSLTATSSNALACEDLADVLVTPRSRDGRVTHDRLDDLGVDTSLQEQHGRRMPGLAA